MKENHIFVGLAAGDRSWRVKWESITGNEPHLAAAMARDVAAVGSTAAHGQWTAEAVKDAVEEISRRYPTLPAVYFEGGGWDEEPQPEPVAIEAPDPDAEHAGAVIASEPTSGV